MDKSYQALEAHVEQPGVIGRPYEPGFAGSQPGSDVNVRGGTGSGAEFNHGLALALEVMRTAGKILLEFPVIPNPFKG